MRKSLFAACFAAYAAALWGASPPPELRARSAALIDATTGTELFAKNAGEPIPPASLTKLMTIHIALREAAWRGINLDARMSLPPPAWARNQPPRSSLMWLDEGQSVTLRDLLLGLAVSSGNDAAVAVALNFAPTIETFTAMMNEAAAREFGMISTVFAEPSGISENNITTAREFASFCRAYIRLRPENLALLHSVPEFSYPRPENVPHARHPRTITQGNHIGLLGRGGVDGLKTGYIDEAGYNIALTAERGETRFIAVLLGVPAEFGAYWGPRYRDADGAALLDWAFENFQTLRFEYPPFREARVWKGRESRVPVKPLLDGQRMSAGALTAPRGRGSELSYRIDYFSGVEAPVDRGKRLGVLTISDVEGEIGRIPLCAARDVQRGGLLKRIGDALIMFFLGVKSA